MLPHDTPGSLDDIGCYLEWICPCHHAFVLRAGPGAKEYGDDFLHAAAGAVQPDGKTAVMKALTATIIPWWLRFLCPMYPVTHKHVRAMIRCMNQYGLQPIWDRKRKNMIDLGFVARLVKGRAKKNGAD